MNNLSENYLTNFYNYGKDLGEKLSNTTANIDVFMFLKDKDLEEDFLQKILEVDDKEFEILKEYEQWPDDFTKGFTQYITKNFENLVVSEAPELLPIYEQTYAQLFNEFLTGFQEISEKYSFQKQKRIVKILNKNGLEPIEIARIFKAPLEDIFQVLMSEE